MSTVDQLTYSSIVTDLKRTTSQVPIDGIGQLKYMRNGSNSFAGIEAVVQDTQAKEKQLRRDFNVLYLQDDTTGKSNIIVNFNPGERTQANDEKFYTLGFQIYQYLSANFKNVENVSSSPRFKGHGDSLRFEFEGKDGYKDFVGLLENIKNMRSFSEDSIKTVTGYKGKISPAQLKKTSLYKGLNPTKTK